MSSSLRSMTGFGTARADEGESYLQVEIRSVNHRYFKLSPRVPDTFNSFLPRLEELLRARIRRGAVYLQIRQGWVRSAEATQLDADFLRQLHAQLKTLAEEIQSPPPSLGDLLLMPGVIRGDISQEEDKELWSSLSQVTSDALDQLEDMRQKEGASIGETLAALCEEILVEATEIEAEAPRVVNDHLQRLHHRIVQLIGQLGEEAKLEPRDLARETAILADKSDVSEELQRLRSHVEQLLETITHAKGPIGRKLEFLSQELMREANTMASKTHDSKLIERILAVKLSVERIREQIANVE